MRVGKLLISSHYFTMGRNKMRFCTTINCMDRQAQLPGIEYFEKRFNGGYFSSITEAGPHLILAEQKKMKSNFFKLGISMENHGPVGLAITRHHGCAGNPAPKDEQIAHV